MDLIALGATLARIRKKASLRTEELARGSRCLTQELLANRLGWSTAAHVSEIEKGRRRPEPKTLRAWIEACEASHSDWHLVNGLAGYLPDTHMPSASKVRVLLKNILEDISCSRYPAYIVDYRNFFWAVNQGCVPLFATSEGLLKEMERPVNIFHVLYDTRNAICQMLQDLVETRLRQIALFKSLNMRRQHEAFYRQFTDIICRTLLPEDAAQFKADWAMDLGARYADDPFHGAFFTFDFPGHGLISFNVQSENLVNPDFVLTKVSLLPVIDDAPHLPNADDVFPEVTQGRSFAIWDYIPVDDMLT